MTAKKDTIALPADPNDPDDFDATREALDRGRKARIIRNVRKDLGLSQAAFAARFRVPVGTLRDWEQARSAAPEYALAYVQVIRHAPGVVEEAIGAP